MKRSTRKALIITSVVAVFIAAACVGSFFYVTRSNSVVKEGSIYVPRDMDYATLVDSLESGERMRFIAPFRAYSRRIGLDGSLKPGHYMLKEGMNIVEVARMFKLGEQTPVNVVMNFARTPQQLAARVARQIEADSLELVTAMYDTALVAQYGFASPLEMFSIFIPNTYEFYWTVTPEDFIKRMKREYDRFWTPERDKKRERPGLSRLEVSTLASILCEETRQTDEMPRMAGVYVNRLKKGMKLQADPTVKYAMGDFALRRILRSHLKTDSPYNTYIYAGLPPTPICMPSIKAMDAVLNYEEHKYIYFCAKEDFSGYHNFAVTYDQHLANARRYTAELNKRNIK